MFSREKKNAGLVQDFWDRWNPVITYDDQGQIRLPSNLIDQFIDEHISLGRDERGGVYVVDSVESHADIPPATPDEVHALKLAARGLLAHSTIDDARAHNVHTTIVEVSHASKAAGLSPTESAAMLSAELHKLANK